MKNLIYLIIILATFNLFAQRIIVESYQGFQGQGNYFSGLKINDFIIDKSIAFPAIDVGFNYSNGYNHNKMLIGFNFYQDILTLKNFNVALFSGIKIGLMSIENKVVSTTAGLNINIYHINLSLQANYYFLTLNSPDYRIRPDISIGLGIIY